MHVQSNVLLVKTHCLDVLTSFDFAKAPCYEANRTDISFLFMAFYIITCVLNIRRVSCHQKVISFKLVFQFLTV